MARLAVPTLGWVAKDDVETTCSFPDGEGLHGRRVGSAATTRDRSPIRDAPTSQSTPAMVAAWVAACWPRARSRAFIAMDNEPELWGHNHYDVHPTCPTYEEMLDRYLTYAERSATWRPTRSCSVR